jgi:hypothetical protein
LVDPENGPKRIRPLSTPSPAAEPRWQEPYYS